MQNVPADVKPPRGLFAKAATIRGKMLTTLPTREAAAPKADEVAFYKMVSEGDALVASGKSPEGIRVYTRAQNFLRARKLSLSTEELDEKIAYAREQQKRPTTAPR